MKILIVERDCHNDFWLVQFLKDAARYYFYLQFRKRVRDIFSFVYQTVISDWPMGWLESIHMMCHFRTNRPNNNRRQLGLALSLSSAPIITKELELAWPSFTDIKTSRGSENDIPRDHRWDSNESGHVTFEYR